MATKKRPSKKGKVRKNLLPTDPPILVGGGGSAYVWLRLDQLATLVDPTSDDPTSGIKPGAPTPRTRSAYVCYRLKHTHVKVTVNNGVDPDLPPVNAKDAKKCHIQFD